MMIPMKSKPSARSTSPGFGNSNQFRRFMLIHGMLENWRSTPVTVASILLRLEKLDIFVTERTVRRDLRDMKAWLELTSRQRAGSLSPRDTAPSKGGAKIKAEGWITYDTAEASLRYTREVPTLPFAADLSPPELLAMAVARQSLSTFEGVGFGDNLRHAFDKITDGRLQEDDLSRTGKLDDLISFRTPGAGKADRKVFDAISNSLISQTPLRIAYQAKGKTEAGLRTLHPYHLACVENRWILVAYDAEKQAIRTFVIARFKKDKLAWGGERFQRPKGFNPVAYLGSSLGIHVGECRHIVECRISPAGAHHVEERLWHKSQKVQRETDGGCKITFEVSDLGDVKRWVLAFGSDCEVLAPQELRGFVAGEGVKLASLYAKDVRSP